MLDFLTYENLYIEIAKELLATPIGTRIPTYDEYQEQYRVSRGNLQRVFADLKARGIITLKPQGYKGTFLVYKNLTGLLQSAGINFLTGYSPLPFSSKFLSLGIYVHDTLNDALKLPVNLTSLNSYQDPVTSVVDNVNNFAIISKYAANKLMEDGYPIEIAYTFSFDKFARPVAYFKDNVVKVDTSTKVAVDTNHPGHYRLIKEYAKKKTEVQIVEVSYSDFPQALINGEVDVIILEEEDMNAVLSEFKPIYLEEVLGFESSVEDMGIGCLITAKTRPEYKQVLKEVLEEAQNDTN